MNYTGHKNEGNSHQRRSALMFKQIPPTITPELSKVAGTQLHVPGLLLYWDNSSFQVSYKADFQYHCKLWITFVVPKWTTFGRFTNHLTFAFSPNSMECRLLPNFKGYHSGRHVSSFKIPYSISHSSISSLNHLKIIRYQPSCFVSTGMN